MTDDEIIAVVTHYKKGGKVQIWGNGRWNDITDPTWNFEQCRYRAKQEPLVLWQLRTEVGESYGTYCNREAAEAVLIGYNKTHAKKLTLKKLVEVTE
jgi:hypothetical protein